MTETEYIDSPEQLAAFVAGIREWDWLAVDTEFIREDSYWPELCLVQVAAGDRLACIDPLQLDEAGMAPLRDLMLDPAKLKVFHAARQDLEVFFHCWQAVPAPVFDTQIAAAMLGHGDQVGYARLVQVVCGKELAKGHTRTDWRARPLSPEAIEYAADDVRYLGPVFEHLRQGLVNSGRMEWLEEEFQSLTDPALYLPDPDNAWKRVKGYRKLKPRQVAVLVSLARWREEEALARNRPRRWILKDQAMIDLARRPPKQASDMEDMRDVPDAVRRRHGDKIVAAAEAGLQEPPPALADTPERLSPAQEALVDAMMAVLRARCADHDMSPAQVATRKQLEALVRGERDLPLLKGWRAAMAGRDLESLLRGDLKLAVSAGRLVFEK
ncbi:ribonuclease D [Gammaproteobacteria bacterium AB-CW1]|uniref:Ribonuclease D n=1 Tax=Natronospira elongata TaxID=3110268 RepID=A0AAP6JH78_9GAMM|nr:ribonuclease D [Gammaproteobacteria bacterium AB-CW1]